ncbi:hypothetical protein JCM17204_30480 [Blautia stercoris]|jgi:hypothetical protein
MILQYITLQKKSSPVKIKEKESWNSFYFDRRDENGTNFSIKKTLPEE